MNLAFSSALLFVAILPGILIRYFYRRGFWQSPVHLSGALNEIYYGVLLAVPIQLAAWWAVGARLGLDVSRFIVLLTGGLGSDPRTVTEPVSAHILTIGLYHLLLNAAAALVGLIAHVTVRGAHLDLRWKTFRFNNPWYYSLSGEASLIARMEEGAGYPGRKRANAWLSNVRVTVSVLVLLGSEVVLYHGSLDRYEFGRDGNLTRLVLRDAYRRRFADDTEGEPPTSNTTIADDPRFYRIVGDHVVIDAKDTRTINVRYVYIVPAGS